MRVYMKRNPAAIHGCRLKEGETGEVSGDVGRALIAAGIAERLDQPSEPIIRAVPAAPAIAEPKPPAIQPAKQPFPQAKQKAPVLTEKPQAVKEIKDG